MTTPVGEAPVLLELEAWRDDAALLSAAEACVRASREAWNAARAPASDPSAAASAAPRASPEALAELLTAGCDVHGIASDASIAEGVVTYNARHIRGALHSEAVAAARGRLDALVRARLAAHFAPERVEVSDSGHFLYPPGTSMGWHTNSGAPGWRLYITHVDAPGRSFFRYRDPRDGRIVTATDDVWNFRLFRITADAPLWHAIASDANRFSFGYRVVPDSFRARWRRRIGRILRR